MKKSSLVTFGIIIVVIILSVIILSNNAESKVSSETAQCIGENSHLYVQLGCHYCEQQEAMFGKNYKHLNVTDCFYEKDKCINMNIQGTPTWIINGQQYVGVKQIEELKRLTGC